MLRQNEAVIGAERIEEGEQYDFSLVVREGNRRAALVQQCERRRGSAFKFGAGIRQRTPRHVGPDVRHEGKDMRICLRKGERGDQENRNRESKRFDVSYWVSHGFSIAESAIRIALRSPRAETLA